jgi:glycosyltransferase involved in cell wall biosynthesis
LIDLARDKLRRDAYTLAGRVISFNGLFLDYPYSGTWVYTRSLVTELARLLPQSRIEMIARRRSWNPPARVHLNVPTWPFPRAQSSAWLESVDKLMWEQVAWPLGAGSDLMHSPYFAAPALKRAPLVVTVHDALPLLPEYGGSGRARLYAKAMRRLTQRADAILTVSNFSREVLVRALSVPQDRIVVTHEAPDASFGPATKTAIEGVRTRLHLPERYVLYVGGTEERKNLRTLVQAWETVEQDDVELVIVGTFPTKNPQLYPDIPAVVRAQQHSQSVKFIPRIAEGDLPAVYSGALAFVYPSKYEGFGLPPLEAMACGAPVLASNTTSLPEVLGDGADMLPPEDIDSWGAALTRIIRDEAHRQDLRERGRDNVSGFSWHQTAASTIGVYAQVVR